MDNIKELAEKLELFRKPKNRNDRQTHCILILTKDETKFRFDVRHWKINENNVVLSCVNWTLAAGPCSVELTNENIKDWDMEDYV